MRVRPRVRRQQKKPSKLWIFKGLSGGEREIKKVSHTAEINIQQSDIPFNHYQQKFKGFFCRKYAKYTSLSKARMSDGSR